MHPHSFITLFFYVSFTLAFESSLWNLDSILRHVSHKRRIAVQHLESRTIPSGWTSVGCVTDGPARALSYSFQSSSLTQESCVATCDSLGYTYSGPEYSSQCFCGNTLANGLGIATSSSDCNMACSGDSSETCGGSYRMSLYQRTTTSTTLSSIPAGWTYVGCATDSSARALPYSFSSSSLTQESCVVTCDSLGYTYSGPQYSDQCYCGYSLANGLGASTPSSDCNMPCAGNSSEICGGSYRFSLFQKTATTSTTSTTTATSTSASLPAGWTYVGCAIDGSARALSYSFSSSSLTQESCVATCNSLGYSYSGPQYSNQCYCGNSLANGLGGSAPSSDCNMPCTGDSSETCGGNYRFSLFQKTATTTTTSTPTATSTSASLPAGWTYVGCAIDGSARALSYSFSSSSLTQESCVTSCNSLGYTYSGPQYSDQCYCGNTLANGLGASAPSSDCNMPCAGNSTENCGGSYRLSLFQKTATTTTTTTTSTTTTSTPAASATAAGWSLSSPCAVDTSARILQGYTYSSSASMTPQACQLACAAKGYHIAGVENGSDCYCGNVYVGGAPASGTASDCSVACTGSSSMNCGGSLRMVLYTNTVATIGELWQTTWDRSKLLTSLSTSIPFTTVGPIAGADITVDETTTYQYMDGFGASLTDSSAKLFANLKAQNSANYYSLLHQLFDIGDGSQSAMSGVLRVPLGATDFSDTQWTYCDTKDTSLASFNINAAPVAVWNTIYDILAINPLIKIYVVPWSPPAWMKSGGTMLGGSLSSSYVGIYPTYLLKALQGFQSKGIPLYAIGIQNEPQYSDTSYPSTLMPVATEATIAQSLRSLMDSNGFSGVKIIGYEHNFNDAAGYPVQLMSSASSSFAGVAFHCYSGTVSKIDSFRSSYPNKEIHLTECSGVYGSDWWSDIKWYIDNLFVGGPEHYGRSSMMWNLALDGSGQPMLPGSKACSTPCRGVVQINSDATWSFNQEYWPISQAGKAIAPKDSGGSFGQRIGVTVGGTYSWALRVGAYATLRKSSSDKTRYSLVVLNWRDYASSAWNPTPQTTTINFRGVQATYTFPVGLTTLSWYA